MCRPRADQTADFRRFSRRKDRLVEETDPRIAKRVKVHSYGSALIDAGGAFDFGDRGFVRLRALFHPFPLDFHLVMFVQVEIPKRTDAKMLSISAR